MEVSEFKASTGQERLPDGLSVHLRALWYDKKGDWHRAHDLIDSLGDEDSAFLHAYLHRKEGDLSNADYWYRRAGKKRPMKGLDEEWEEMVRYFLSR
ncbi:hypothetical protein [Negadavirga shengliensis]|uniref:Uncharacterized protein n=1 Tax=Negadavirga shengliensis TaxID=1389218 RepID=A0ABV9T3T9_9BACT